jgi:hypothetical protein
MQNMPGMARRYKSTPNPLAPMSGGKIMTRKDFQAIADILASNRGMGDPGMYHEMVMDFARLCKSRNPNFKIEKFLAAAGDS